VIRRLVAIVSVVLSACPTPIGDRCGDGLPPCPANLVCVMSLCARPEPDGGAGTDGGTLFDGGAIDAGRTFTCDGGCAPWAVCLSSSTTAACVNGRLETTEPVDGTTLRAGQAVTLAVRFLLVDGGAWPNTIAIPVQTDWAAQTMLLSGIAGSVPGLTDAGRGTVVFGWDGGPLEPRALSFSACSAEVIASCPPYQECAPSVAGGDCVSHGFVVEWVSPDAGSATNQSSVAAEVRVTKPDGGMVALTSIPVNGATPFTGSAGRYTGALPIAPPDGVKTFTAGWPADGASSSLSIERDTIAPSVTVVVEPRNGPDPDVAAPTAWKKDEKALIKITVDGGRPAVESDFLPPPNGVVTPEVCAGCSAACRCFGIDVSSSPLNGLRGPMGVQVLPINDPAGNRTEQKDAGFDVTRLRWVRTATLSSFMTEVHPPAISDTGLVVYSVGGRNPGLPTIQTFDPTGNLLWTAAPDVMVTAAPVISGTTVWAAISDGFSLHRMTAFSLRDGGVESVRCLDGGLEFYRSMALASFDGGVTVPVGVGDVIAFGSTACPTGFFGAGFGAAIRSPIALRQVGPTLELFKAGGNRLSKYETQGASWLDRGSRNENPGLTIQGLAFDSAGRLIGGGARFTMGGGGVFMVSASDHLDAGWFTPQPALLSAPVVSADSILGVSSNGNLMRIPYGVAGLPDAGVEAGPAALAGGQEFALGESRIVTAGSVLTAPMGSSIRFGQLRPGDLSVEWAAELASAQMTSGWVVSPALDVLRSDGGVKDCTRQIGVAYVSTALGTNATLYSILVDARGLDPTAPWPRFQRDNANRGNISLPTSPWTCP